MLLIQLLPSHSIYMVGHTALSTQQSYLILPPFQHCREGSSLSGCVPADDTVNSEYVVGA